MIITIIFALFAAAFATLIRSQKLFGHPPSLGSAIALGVPWVFLISAGVYWGFLYERPDYGLRVQEASYAAEWLVGAVLVAVPLSYVACYKVAAALGREEGRKQTLLSGGPILLKDGGPDTPTQIAMFQFKSCDLQMGSDILCNGRYYTVTSREPRNELLYVVATGKPAKDPLGDRAKH